MSPSLQKQRIGTNAVDIRGVVVVGIAVVVHISEIGRRQRVIRHYPLNLDFNPLSF